MSKNTKKRNPDIELNKIHNYFGVDLDIVWNIIENDLPELKVKIKRILEGLVHNEDS